MTTSEARIRFMEFVILNCLASREVTRKSMVLKGGNGLRFAYQSPRSTKDLDFSVVADGIPDDADKIRDLLNDALTFAHRRFNVKAKCQRVKRNPDRNRPGTTRPTYDVAVGYQFPTDRYFRNFEDRDLPTVIPLEITLNDLVCDTAEWAGVQGLMVCSLEDILAEKLRDLLQQKIRKRNRGQDVYDIGRYARRSGIDRDKIAEFLKQKSAMREIEVRKSNFDDEIRTLAATGYEERVKTPDEHDFIPFGCNRRSSVR